MKLFKAFLILFVIVGAFVGISRFFPHVYYTDRSVTINKPVDTVFHYMNDLRNWEEWSMWNKELDSTMITFYGKRSDSLGGRQYFKGDLLRSGRFLIDRYTQNAELGYNLNMNDGDVNANGLFRFRALDSNTTELHWIDSGDVGNNPIMRYMIPSKVSSTITTFDNGLQRIKKQIESKK